MAVKLKSVRAFKCYYKPTLTESSSSQLQKAKLNVMTNVTQKQDRFQLHEETTFTTLY